MRAVSLVVAMAFLTSDCLWAAEPSSLFELKREKEKQESKFLPRYLLEQQRKHEEFMQRREDLSDLARSLEDEFTERMRSRKKPLFEDDRRRGGGEGGAGRLEYTLTDSDEGGRPTTLNLYEYEGDNLARIVQYDVTDAGIQHFIDSAREIEGRDGDKFLGGFQNFQKQGLSDAMIASITYFKGEGDQRRTSHVFGGFEDDTNLPTQLSLYQYEGEALKEVRTYNIEGKNLTPQPAPPSLQVLLKEDLESISIYKGEKEKEQILYTLSDYDNDNDPTSLTYYEYDPSGKLKEVKTFDISDVKRFVADNYFNFRDESFKNVLLSEKLKKLSPKELLELLSTKGLLKASADEVLGSLSKDQLLGDIQAQELLHLLYTKGFLSEDAGATLSKLDFQKVFEEVKKDKLLEILEDKQALKEGQTAVSVKQTLASQGVNIDTLSNDELLEAVSQAGLLQKTISEIKSNLGTLELLQTLSSSQILNLLASPSIGLLIGSSDSVLSNLIDSGVLSSKEDLGNLTTSELLELLVNKGLSKGSLDDLLGGLLFEDVFDTMKEDELLKSLLEEGLVQGQDLNSLKALLGDLSGKTNDDILALLESKGLLESATLAKEALKEAFETDKEAFLNSLSTSHLLEFLASQSLLAVSIDHAKSLISTENILGALELESLLEVLDQNAKLSQSIEESLNTLKADLLQGLSDEELFNLLRSEGRLRSIAVYEGEKKKERIKYTLSDDSRDREGLLTFRKRTDYLYKGEVLDETRTYDIKNLPKELWTILGAGRLEQIADYAGRTRGKETINTILSDFLDGEAQRRQDYVYGLWRRILKSVDQYFIGDLLSEEKTKRGRGDLISKSLYKGPRGSERIDSVEEYNLDREVINLQKYVYEGRPSRRGINYVQQYDPSDLSEITRVEYEGQRRKERISGIIGPNDISVYDLG
ncbi:MAG: hypothetical protein HY593_04060, partial [Candidatus Omnitrophica bacterium]|nr:hypothetical protein [Candidatus Omnitrophota bacterium]